ncbi:HAMP domain-containing sensor histidine kinase [Pseudohongiella sp. SYSU M77423]|uniref:sensor histidine kinase n=1 Tax=unclassified Pseudohongiella TaxID=2629611 RepID=UPI001F2C3C84|nr:MULTISPECIES: HAMP domain-containing sensor histidine kinase [unclassified Pseudohongiella]MDH7944822.1 HAMP domain-containing sensor histidine kinase [Pseudohongiella sp. SYSU M77423]
MSRYDLWNLFLCAVLLLTGLAISSLAAWQVSTNDQRLWQLQSVTNAERLSAELRFRILANREPLIAIASLYSGSDDVTQSELVAAHELILETTDNQIAHSVAFVTNQNGDYLAEQANGELALLPTRASSPLDTQLRAAVDAARMMPGAVVIHAPIRKDGDSYLPMVLTASNGDTGGVLMLLLDFSRLLSIVMSDVLNGHTTVNIYHPLTPGVNHANLPPLSTEAENRHTVRVPVGLDIWQLEWLFDADQAPDIDISQAYLVLFGGILISMLLSLVFYTLLQQRAVVNQQISQRTEELRQTQHQLLQKEKMAALGQLVSGVTQGLDRPINQIRETVTELEQRLAGDSKTGSALTALDQNVRRAIVILNGFQRIASDQSTEQRRSFNLLEAIEELAETLGPGLQTNKLKLQLDVPGNIILDSYPGALYQVLSALIGNALVHAYPPGHKAEGILSLSAELQRQSVSLRFADDGVGIPAEMHNRIFEPFFTTQAAAGSGLGLHIAYTRVVDLLGGSICLIPSETGSCFEIILPLSAPMRADGH